MQTNTNYFDDEPKAFERDDALTIIQHAKQYFGQYALIENKQYKFTQMDNKDAISIDATAKNFLYGTLISDDRCTKILSLDKIIILFQEQ
ncbi:hypothetical protein [Dysgonomonas sp.]